MAALLVSMVNQGLSAQASDSLIASLGKGDSADARTYARLVQELWGVQPDSALGFGRLGLSHANRLEDDTLRFILLSDMGIAHYYAGRNDSSLALLRQAKALAGAGKDSLRVLRSNQRLGIVLASQSAYYQALDLFKENLQLAQGLRDTGSISTAYLNIAVEYHRLGDMVETIKLNQQALRLQRDRKRPDMRTLATIYQNLGAAYGELRDYTRATPLFHTSLRIAKQFKFKDLESANNVLMGLGHAYKENYDSAIHYVNLSIPVFDSLNQKLYLAQAINNRALAFRESQQYDKALSDYELALSKYRALGNINGVALAQCGMAELYRKQGLFTKAKAFIDSSFQLSKEHGLLVEMRDASQVKLKLQLQLLGGEELLAQLDLYEEIKDSIASREDLAKLEMLDQAQKAKEIERLNSINKKKGTQLSAEKQLSQRLILVVAALILVVLVLAYLINDKVRKSRLLKTKNSQIIQQKDKIEEQHEDLKQTLARLDEAHRELKAAQKQMLQAEKMASLGQLTAGIAHEINNPVNFIQAGIDSLKMDMDELADILGDYEGLTKENFEQLWPKLAERQKQLRNNQLIQEMEQLTESIQRGADRTTEIIKGLRIFSRIDDDELKEADLEEALDNTLLLLGNELKDRVALHRSYEGIGLVSCYPEKMNQVFMNLLANAAQAISGEGRIWLGTKRTEDGVWISIKDNGSGMEEAVKERVFEPFFTTKEVGLGTGLGLSIAHSIVEKHGGKIELESEIGAGTEFRIFLPHASQP